MEFSSSSYIIQKNRRVLDSKYTLNWGLKHHSNLEIIWTVIPMVILFIISFPSFALLYYTEPLLNPQVQIKAIGHQWWWGYEYQTKFKKSKYVEQRFNVDDIFKFSHNKYKNSIALEQIPLLTMDNSYRVCLPIQMVIKVLVTSSDVIHSWAIPSLGVKVDAVPGRLNELGFKIYREGIFYGQCSEICGVYHGFMPISIKAVSMRNYFNWGSGDF